jgi:hypothetical protein
MQIFGIVNPLANQPINGGAELTALMGVVLAGFRQQRMLNQSDQFRIVEMHGNDVLRGVPFYLKDALPGELQTLAMMTLRRILAERKWPGKRCADSVRIFTAQGDERCYWSIEDEYRRAALSAQ